MPVNLGDGAFLLQVDPPHLDAGRRRSRRGQTKAEQAPGSGKSPRPKFGEERFGILDPVVKIRVQPVAFGMDLDIPQIHAHRVSFRHLKQAFHQRGVKDHHESRKCHGARRDEGPVPFAGQVSIRHRHQMHAGGSAP